ncbi:MAG TPA: alpha/beta hydrolase-fold protein [Clostridia bacterium]|nr:alpha/beta hydrolase-fold protein [Clostridia bacterium]
MHKRIRALFPVLLVAMFALQSLAQTATPAQPLRFSITLADSASATPVSGRLIVFMSTQKPRGSAMEPGFGGNTRNTWIAAQEVTNWKPGTAVELDPDRLAYPAPFSKAPAGDYYVMSFLDVNHNAAYRTYDAGDIIGDRIIVEKLNPAMSQPIALRIERKVPVRDAKPSEGSELFDFVSPSLSAFWGRPIHMRGVIVLPPSYKKSRQRYPTVYMTHGYGATLNVLAGPYAHGYADKMAGGAPQMIYVLLDESCPGGTHEFADSVNNGPWGHALTAELIPHLEKKYRMDAKPSGRFLTGHSSGGWATLWLQVNYPKIFGGTWSTSPDPTDFRDFIGPDLTKANTNMYRKPDGSPWMLVRMDGKDVEAFEDFARQERVMGEYGGQIASFEWVFSPRGPDGRPMQLFDRDTGVVHPAVAKYWVEHYDISSVVRKRWKEIGPSLKGKINVIVGTADTFHLEGPARLLDGVLKDLGADAKVTYLEGRTHFDLFKDGLDETIAKEMYSVARPKTKVKSAAGGK